MKSYFNDTIKRLNNPNKKNFIKRKNNSLIINSQDIPYNKTNYIKNTKKIIKTRLNSTKEMKKALKKPIISNFHINNKLQTQKDNNIQTIDTRPIKAYITPPRQTKIRIIKPKPHQQSRKNKNLNSELTNKFTKETKLVNSISTGLSNGTLDREGECNNFLDSDENNERIGVNNYNYNADSHSNKLETILFEEKTNNINNFYYETLSKEDSNENENENKIILKCDNYSLLTFGNSFSYSNSHKRQTNKQFFNKENDFNYINKLKEENEFLKKELKESTEQISFLILQIKDLKDNKFLPIKKNKRKSLYRNVSIKVNKTKEGYQNRIKNNIIVKNKLNNMNSINIAKKTKNSNIMINSKKYKSIKDVNNQRGKKSSEKLEDYFSNIKL